VIKIYKLPDYCVGGVRCTYDVTFRLIRGTKGISHFDVKGEYQVVDTIRLRVPIQSTGGVIRSSVEVAGMVMERSGYKKVKANSGRAWDFWADCRTRERCWLRS
jgi:hypothetical protein